MLVEILPSSSSFAFPDSSCSNWSLISRTNLEPFLYFVSMSSITESIGNNLKKFGTKEIVCRRGTEGLNENETYARSQWKILQMFRSPFVWRVVRRQVKHKVMNGSLDNQTEKVFAQDWVGLNSDLTRHLVDYYFNDNGECHKRPPRVCLMVCTGEM